MPCPACEAAAASVLCGLYRSGCQQCRTRGLAGGMLFWQAQRARAITADYRAALEKVFGSDWEDGHQAVKAEAARLKGKAK